VLIFTQEPLLGYCVDMDTSGTPEWRASNPTELGRALARARQSRGLNQETLAARLGIHRSYLARMEAGLSTEQFQRTFAVLREMGMELAIVEREPRG
jgi:ribosome-binding protein aMBF1 (putative translation factor)